MDLPALPRQRARGRPAMPVIPIRLAYLIVEITATGGTLISWHSLDDRTPRRMLLPGIVLDPVWEEYDSGYFNFHGNYHFALSPRLGAPVTFTAAAPTLGPLDTAMVAGFTAALPTITANLQNSVANAAHYTPQPSNPGDRAFYRFAADWSVDSDGDGRLDWQELVLDGNNPFSADSDGDGFPDQPQAGNPLGGYPTPTDAQPATPLAHIEQQTITARRTSTIYDDGTLPLQDATAHEIWDVQMTPAQHEALKNSTTLPTFKQAVEALPFTTGGWGPLAVFSVDHFDYPVEQPSGQKRDRFDYVRSRFRLHLNAPAPPGGYRIPLRIGIVRQSIDAPLHEFTLDSSPGGEAPYEQIMLECAEGETEGIPVEFSNLALPGSNKSITFVPACVTTREPDTIPEIDGLTIPPTRYRDLSSKPELVWKSAKASSSISIPRRDTSTTSGDTRARSRKCAGRKGSSTAKDFSNNGQQ